MPVPNIGCLSSTLKNTSGGERTFGFIPPHGRRLGVNEQITIFGSIVEYCSRKTRNASAIQRALLDGSIQILSTPNVYTPGAGGVPKMIGTNAGVLGLVDPCWLPSGGGGSSDLRYTPSQDKAEEAQDAGVGQPALTQAS